MQWHLAALESGRHLIAGLRALGAAAGGLAPCAGITSADAGFLGTRARRWAQVMDLERHD
jgi:hypothetical protein